jgi:hypothetical protein
MYELAAKLRDTEKKLEVVFKDATKKNGKMNKSITAKWLLLIM